MTEKQNAIIAAAKKAVIEWDRYEIHWQDESQKRLVDPIIGEPTDIAAARMLVEVVEQNAEGWRNAESILTGVSDD